MSDLNLTQIVKEVQKDIGQFELLYSQIVNKVYYWCVTIIGNETEAKDVAQEAMISIYNKLHTLREPETFNTWIYVITKNSCYAYLRKQKKLDEVVSYSDDFLDIAGLHLEEGSRDILPKEAYDLKETKSLVAKFIQKLPRKQKEIIILYYLEGFSIKEIAKVQESSLGSVRSRLHEGRKSLERMVLAYEEENNIKLHNFAWLPLLGDILREDQTAISQRQDLRYDEKLYKGSNSSLLKKISKFMSEKLVMMIGIVVGIALVTTVLAFVLSGSSKPSINEFDPLLVYDEDVQNKIKKGALIERIEYPSFPIKTSVEVSIVLKKDMKKDDIKILFNGEEVTFDKVDRNITVRAEENGKYQIFIGGGESYFIVDNIDENAPELLEVQNNGEYLELIISDPESQMNYDESYVEQLGWRHKIGENLKVYGEFQGSVLVVLFTKENRHIEYLIKVD